MATIFSRIISGEIPCYKIAENANFLAFLDINPLAAGHTLVIPKTEVDYIFNMEDEFYAGLWKYAKEVAKALERAVPCKRIGIAVIGLEVAHAHIHLIPITTVDQINFSRPKLTPQPEELSETAEKIKEFITF